MECPICLEDVDRLVRAETGDLMCVECETDLENEGAIDYDEHRKMLKELGADPEQL